MTERGDAMIIRYRNGLRATEKDLDSDDEMADLE
jgi:hypothetical protein